MPDNGLANLAGALIEAGHETLILDYGTVDTIKRLYPAKFARKAVPFCERVFSNSNPDYKFTYRDMLLLKYLDWHLARHQRRGVDQIAQEICNKIKEYKPDFVGFKLWTGDGFCGSVQIAETIKRKFPGLPIIAGGPHVDVFRELIIKQNGAFDVLTYAEGEETIVRLAECLKEGRSFEGVPNLIYKGNGTAKITDPKWVEKLDDLPYPNYDEEIYPSMGGNQKVKIITVDESRGCFSCCYFCPHPKKSGTRLRMKTPERFVAEIERMMDAHSFTAFRYAGSATPTLFARKIADLIAKKKLGVDYSMFGNIIISRGEDFDALRDSGCRAIFFGLESGSEKLLKAGIGKKFKVDEARKVLKACKTSGIFTITSIIFPAPFENEATRNETVELLKEVRPDSVIVTFPILTPTTTWAAEPDRFGFRITDGRWIENAMDYKIKWLFPPRFWKALPYTLNDRKFGAYTRMTSDFTHTLRKEGFLVGMSDELLLMADRAGFKGRERNFMNHIMGIFFSGDWEKAQDLNRVINKAVAEKSSRKCTYAIQ
jgi:radical SAM superfamily enzyme YgiQ (UPF0313 family)